VTVVGEALVDLMDGVAYPGGGPANIALGLARLGLAPTLLTQLGDDAYGALVREHLTADGVRVVSAGPPGEPTGTAAAVVGADGAASYEFAMSWRVRDLALAEGSAALHVGSLGLALEPGAATVLELVERTAGRALVSYDPNVRPTLTPDLAAMARRVDRVAALADLVKLSADDLAVLYGDASAEDVAGRWLYPAGRARLVVVTLGGSGALAVTPSGPTRVPGIPVELVDTVGAGDTFQAALLAALAAESALSPAGLAALPPAALDRVLSTATAAAAFACTRPGADPPTRDELSRFLATR